MKGTEQIRSVKAAMPALALAAILMLFAPAAAFAFRGGEHFGGRGYGHAFHGGRGYDGGWRGNGGGAWRGRGAWAGHEGDWGRAYGHWRGGYDEGYHGGFYHGDDGGFYPGRFYAGRGYYWGGRFWARPYFGVGIGIPFGWGYNVGPGCGYYDGWGYWRPAPCYPYIDPDD
jgi:hypothetical protein